MLSTMQKNKRREWADPCPGPGPGGDCSGLVAPPRWRECTLAADALAALNLSATALLVVAAS